MATIKGAALSDADIDACINEIEFDGRWPIMRSDAMQIAKAVLRAADRRFTAEQGGASCEWTNCPRRVGDVCCNDRAALTTQAQAEPADTTFRISPPEK